MLVSQRTRFVPSATAAGRRTSRACAETGTMRASPARPAGFDLNSGRRNAADNAATTPASMQRRSPLPRDPGAITPSVVTSGNASCRIMRPARSSTAKALAPGGTRPTTAQAARAVARGTMKLVPGRRSARSKRAAAASPKGMADRASRAESAGTNSSRPSRRSRRASSSRLLGAATTGRAAAGSSARALVLRDGKGRSLTLYGEDRIITRLPPGLNRRFARMAARNPVPGAEGARPARVRGRACVHGTLAPA